MFVRRAAGPGRWMGLVKERHRKFTKVEQTPFDTFPLLEMMQNPSRRLLGKPAFTCAADDYRDRYHVDPFLFSRMVLSIRLLMWVAVRCFSNPADLDHVETSAWPDSASVPAANSPSFFRRP